MFTKLFAVSAIACMATAVQAQEVTTPPTFNIDPGEVGVILQPTKTPILRLSRTVKAILQATGHL